VESSAPGLFSITASPKKKKPGMMGTGDVKIQLKHTDTSTSLHVIVRFFPN
jgi:hypothetical protein